MSVEVTTTQQQNSGSANTPDSPELTQVLVPLVFRHS